MNATAMKQRSKYTDIALGIACGAAAMWMYGVLFSEQPSGAAINHASEAVHEEPTLWTCSMHPQIQKTGPGKCPLCGMDLIPAGSGGEEDSPRHLVMTESAKKLAEIATAPVERKFIAHKLRLVGKVEYDESRVKYITAWFPGRLERLFVDSTGTPVKAGEHLVEIYSPEILTDQEALLQARRAVTQTPATDAGIQRSRTESLERARNRLRLFGLTKRQIEDIESQGSPTERITFYSPIDGVVIHKSAYDGDYVQTGSRIYTIADLSQVWVKLDAYESDLQWLHYGQDAAFTAVSYPGEEFHGRVALIDPFLDERTRTIKVRINVDNMDGKLKPGMLVRGTVDAEITDAGRILDANLAGKWMCSMHPEIVKDDPGECDICGMPLVTAESLGFTSTDMKEPLPPLVIPASSVLLTGKRAVVYVEVPNTDKPTFEGREIVPGPRLGDFYAVKSGLAEGERIVVNGSFKIDSALQIQAKPSMMSPGGNASPPERAHSDMAMDAGENESMQALMVDREALAVFLPPYRELASALASDLFENARSAAESLEKIAAGRDSANIQKPAAIAAHSGSIEDIRGQFDLISKVLIHSVEMQGSPKDDLFLAFCPMAFENAGARWLQWDETIRNPYFGGMMLTCGSIEKKIPATAER